MLKDITQIKMTTQRKSLEEILQQSPEEQLSSLREEANRMIKKNTGGKSGSSDQKKIRYIGNKIEELKKI
ncbi:MAG: hypothetical protein ACPGJP_05055 [Hyphomicrobiales bacterium]